VSILQLLWRAVLQGRSHRFHGGWPSGRIRRLGGDAEVEELHAAARDHHVGGLQIAMDDAAAMRLVQGIDDLDGVRQRLLDRHRPPRETLLQRLTFDVLHHQVLDAILLADVVDRADVWVVEARDDLGFTPERAARRRIVRAVRRQDLDRDRPVQARVDSAVHLAHPAGRHHRLELVDAEGPPGVATRHRL